MKLSSSLNSGSKGTLLISEPNNKSFFVGESPPRDFSGELKMCSNQTLEDLCINTIARIAPVVDLLKLAKHIPCRCFVHILEALIRNSKISVGNAFHVMQTLMELDPSFFDFTTFRLACESCDDTLSIRIAKESLLMASYECQRCYFKCSNCIFTCIDCDLQVCKECADNMIPEIDSTDEVESVIKEELVEIYQTQNLEHNLFECYHCLKKQFYDDIKEDYFQVIMWKHKFTMSVM